MRQGDPRNGHRYRQLRAQVAAEEPLCHWCGCPFPPVSHPHPASRSIEHLVPIELGGPVLDRDNVAAAHLKCNQLRSPAFTLVDGQLVALSVRSDASRRTAPVPTGRRGYYCDNPTHCPTPAGNTCGGPHSGIQFPRNANGFDGLHWEGP